MDQIRVLLVDDHALFRQGVASILQRAGDRLIVAPHANRLALHRNEFAIGRQSGPGLFPGNIGGEADAGTPGKARNPFASSSAAFASRTLRSRLTMS